MRSAAHVRRRENPADSEECAARLVENFFKHVRLGVSDVVASYAATPDEFNPATLDAALRKKGHKVALPVIVGRQKPLVFRLHEEGWGLLANPLGIFEPMSTAPGVEPDILLFPMLAFDRARNRLGYGGGYYDRTIKRLRRSKPVLAVGLAYAFQEVDHVPIGPNDVVLDCIVTDRDVL